MEKNSVNEGLKRELGIIDIGASVVNMTVADDTKQVTEKQDEPSAAI